MNILLLPLFVIALFAIITIYIRRNGGAHQFFSSSAALSKALRLLTIMVGVLTLIGIFFGCSIIGIFSALLIAIVVVSAVMLSALLLLVIFLKGERRLQPFGLVLLQVVFFVIAVAAVLSIQPKLTQASFERGDRLLAALQDYKAKHGVYPAELRQLQIRLPRPMIIGSHFEYNVEETPVGQECIIRFLSTLNSYMQRRCSWSDWKNEGF